MAQTANNPIRLIVGLGNPGDEYKTTRHNMGFMFLDALASKYGARFSAEARFNGARPASQPTPVTCGF